MAPMIAGAVFLSLVLEIQYLYSEAVGVRPSYTEANKLFIAFTTSTFVIAVLATAFVGPNDALFLCHSMAGRSL